jgi:hypothetical protein
LTIGGSEDDLEGAAKGSELDLVEEGGVGGEESGFEGLLHGASREGDDRIFYDAIVDYALLDVEGF